MHHRIIQVESPAFLSLDLTRLQIQRNSEILAQIPLEDLGFVVLDGPEITITAQLLSACAEQNIGVVFTGPNHMPVGCLQPFAANALHAETLRLQSECSIPKKKRVWQQIVQAKLTAQAGHLESAGVHEKRIARLIPNVLSGDSTNREGFAAAIYWDKLFGPEFSRERSSQGTNAMLNYGYAVLRALVARALCGAGLHPAFGVFHHNRYNPFALVDDAIEPLRPIVDSMVYQYTRKNQEPEALTPAIKRYLVQITVLPVTFAGTDHHIVSALEKYAASLRRAICEDARKIAVPEPIWSAVIDKCG